jgi:uncharacterized protein
LDNLEKLGISLRSLAVFRGLLGEPLIKRLLKLLGSAGKGTAAQVDAYAAFAAELLGSGANLTDCILRLALEDENAYAVKRGAGEETIALEEALKSELAILQEVSRLDPSQLRKRIAYDGYLPGWATYEADLVSEYRERIKNLAYVGYGVFARHSAFLIRGGELAPVFTPDPVRLSDLKGYEKQRQAVIDNTLALLEGKPAANILLYGDAGTGKSSTVKAVANGFRDKGLRLVETGKNEAGGIPAVLERLSRNPLKFILFIDDLTFGSEGDDFYALKAVLEGSAAARTPNIAVYATSNRRHLIRESFSDRQGDDVHVSETIQETISLSARFPLTIGFFRPDRELYFRIVRELARQYGVAMDAEKLEAEAENFASEGRSPRAARQFVDYLKRTGK